MESATRAKAPTRPKYRARGVILMELTSDARRNETGVIRVTLRREATMKRHASQDHEARFRIPVLTPESVRERSTRGDERGGM